MKEARRPNYYTNCRQNNSDTCTIHFLEQGGSKAPQQLTLTATRPHIKLTQRVKDSRGVALGVGLLYTRNEASSLLGQRYECVSQKIRMRF
jgi:hypothetical protein